MTERDLLLKGGLGVSLHLEAVRGWHGGTGRQAACRGQDPADQWGGRHGRTARPGTVQA
jgi:hypothetical protein